MDGLNNVFRRFARGIEFGNKFLDTFESFGSGFDDEGFVIDGGTDDEAVSGIFARNLFGKKLCEHLADR